jgi:hypothetical protein
MTSGSCDVGSARSLGLEAYNKDSKYKNNLHIDKNVLLKWRSSTYLSSREFVRPNLPHPEIRRCCTNARALASHGMRIGKCRNVDMAAKIL